MRLDPVASGAAVSLSDEAARPAGRMTPTSRTSATASARSPSG